jgi:hypothetical protein
MRASLSGDRSLNWTRQYRLTGVWRLKKQIYWWYKSEFNTLPSSGSWQEQIVLVDLCAMFVMCVVKTTLLWWVCSFWAGINCIFVTFPQEPFRANRFAFQKNCCSLLKFVSFRWWIRSMGNEALKYICFWSTSYFPSPFQDPVNRSISVHNDCVVFHSTLNFSSKRLYRTFHAVPRIFSAPARSAVV